MYLEICKSYDHELDFFHLYCGPRLMHQKKEHPTHDLGSCCSLSCWFSADITKKIVENLFGF